MRDTRREFLATARAVGCLCDSWEHVVTVEKISKGICCRIDL